jgi:GT2 family glycosyltransferase
VKARIDRVAWLAPGLALLVGEFDGEIASISDPELDSEPVEARSFRCVGPNGVVQLLTLYAPGRVWPSDRLGRLTYSSPSREVLFEPADIGDTTVDLQTLIRTTLAPLPSVTRAEVLEFLAATPAFHPSAAGITLTKTLVVIREALRERLRPCVISRDEAIGLAIECVLAVDERRFFAQGWFRDAEATVTSLRAVSPEGSSIELLDRIYRFPRPDLESLYGVLPGDPRAGTGFACCFDLIAPSTASGGWILELRNSAGSAVEAVAPPAIVYRDEVRNRLLGDIELEHPGDEALTRDHIFPAISRLQELNSERLQIERIVQFGEAPANPKVSIVVPLYRRIDFLEHQLAQFSLDPEIAHSDLIYVLDSPERSRDLIALATALVDLYRVPFRVATLAENVGFAGANSAGASLARGRLLLFMNSDVLPEQRGWLGRMISFYDSKPGIGALGPKLLFEDDSIQHAGLFFRRPLNSTLWSNEHYFKGLHRDIPPATISRVVPAVTAACMLVDRALFDEVGGFSATFVRGDFEDSDLCLRLLEAGRQSWYCADIVLYHLEGQSYESSLRRNAWRYNAWLHTHIWGERIATLMRGFQTQPDATHPHLPVRIAELVPMQAMNGDGAEVETG